MKRLVPLLLLGVAACGGDPPDQPVTASLIGTPAPVDPSREPLDAASAALIGAIGQGLVRFDANGQIEPGLAIRWGVSDDGLTYTFRLAPGAPIKAEMAARRLRAAISLQSVNPLRHVLGVIDEVNAITPEILEIGLLAPRPDLLSLLAQPELALDPVRGRTGPMRVERREGDLSLLSPLPGDEADRAEWDAPARKVRLRGEPAAHAVARFRSGSAQLVLGGTFADVAIGQLGDDRGRLLHFDPAPGLFGLQFTAAHGLAADPLVRRALSMAVDRERLVATFGVPGWLSSPALLRGADDVPQPAAPDWAGLALADRREQARAEILAWKEIHPGSEPQLSVELPTGPGARMLLALLAQDFASIGVALTAATDDEMPDLVLVDEVAPGVSAAWHLRHFTCDRAAICSPEADAELAAARAALSLEQRAAHLAIADGMLERATPFIPLASPLRWMLVAPGVTARENPRAVHPLYHLRDPG